MSDKLKLEPEKIVFTGPFEKTQVQHKATNISPNRITIKVKCSDTNSVQASPVFALIDPNETINMTFQCRFPDGQPKPKKTYEYGIVVADAPADLTKDTAKIKEAWATLAPSGTIKLICEFVKPGEQPPAADAPTAEAPAPPSGFARKATPAEDGAAPADAAPAE